MTESLYLHSVEHGAKRRIGRLAGSMVTYIDSLDWGFLIGTKLIKNY